MKCPDELVLWSPGAQQPRASGGAGALHGRWIGPYAAELAKLRAPEMVLGPDVSIFSSFHIPTVRLGIF